VSPFFRFQTEPKPNECTLAPFNHKLVFTAACFGMLIFGIVMAVLGSVLPSVMIKFDVGSSEAGTLFIFLSGGLMFGSLLFGPIVDRFGYRSLLIICSVITTTGFQGIAFSPSMTLLGFSIFLSGCAGAALNGATNALVSEISEGKRGSRLTFLGVFFGIGAFGVPLLLGSLLDRYSYESLISGIGLMILMPFIFFLFLRFPPPKHVRGFPLSKGVGLAKEPALLLFGFILLIQSGLEMSMGGWSAAYFTEVLLVSPQYGVLFLSLFWMGLTLTRLLLGYLLIKTNTATIMYISFAFSFTGALILLSAVSTPVAVVGVILVGVGFAAVFPVILAYVGDLYAHLSGTAFSIVFVMSLLGGMSMPYLIGVVSDLQGLRIGMILIPVSIVASFVLFRISHYRSAKKSTGTVSTASTD